MKVSVSWLQQYLSFDAPIADVAERLTMVGLEVDSLADRYGWLETVKVGKITAVRPHPNADKLSLCDVTLGDRTLSIVCGAPNAAAGMRAPLALPGTEFPDGKVLETGVIRGERSEGMLCSEKELELGPDASGLMALPPETEVGASLSEALKLSDPVIEIDLTPNRPDCLSLLGVAREIGAYVGRKITYPEAPLPEGEKAIADLASVTIDDPDHCPRYAARLIEGITIKPSPFWLQDRLLSVGLRPINNIVDVTNYVMMETGQPLHAFDFDHLAGHRIVVRCAKAGESFTTLDGKARTLTDEMLMICDGEKPVAVGGVMGGLNSEIEDSTTRVLIESAYFDPASIRKTARTLGLGTDASHRFERGVDPDGTLFALNRAAQLMLEVAGGTLIHGVIDERPKMVQNSAVTLGVADTNRLLGIDLDAATIAELLESIEFRVEDRSQDRLIVMPPSFRVDVARPEDLMEEVARLWGYNRIPVTFPSMPSKGASADAGMVLRNRIKDIMSGFGFSEIITYSFISETAVDKLVLKEDDDRRRMLKILNPISEDHGVMRTSLVPGLLETMQRNLAWQNRTLKLFEVGNVFLGNGQDALPDEQAMIAGLWTGNRTDTAWYSPETACDFYDLKGAVEGLLARLGIHDVTCTAADPETCRYTRPGRTAAVFSGGTLLGSMGEVHPAAERNYDLKQPAFIFELRLGEMSALIRDEKEAAPIPRFPSVARDVTFIVDRTIESEALLRSVREQKEPLLEEIYLFDVYEGDKMAPGKKSLSLRMIYRAAGETLEDETVTEIHQRISQSILTAFNATFPS